MFGSRSLIASWTPVSPGQAASSRQTSHREASSRHGGHDACGEGFSPVHMVKVHMVRGLPVHHLAG